MKAYKELSVEIGKSKLLEQSPPEGTEPSRAGKVTSRRAHAAKSWMDTVVGRDYLTAKKLRCAASEGTYEQVLEMIRKGANVTTADSKGRTALHFAACRGDTNMVKVLISYGASVNQQDCNGSTALHLACCTHHVGVVTALLKAGTDINTTDFRGVTPLHLALSRLKMLGEGTAPPSSPSPSSSSSLPPGEGVSVRRKKEITQIVEMIQGYLQLTDSTKAELEELEGLASRLSLSETPQEVDEVQGLLESFTSLSIEKRQGT